MEDLQDNVDSNVLEHHSGGHPQPGVPHSPSSPARRAQHASHDAAEQPQEGAVAACRSPSEHSNVQAGNAAACKSTSEKATGIQGTLSTLASGPEAASQDSHADSQLATCCSPCKAHASDSDGTAQPERSLLCGQGHELQEVAATACLPSAVSSSATTLKHLPCDVRAWQPRAEDSPPEATEAVDGTFQVSACVVPTQSTALKPSTTALLHGHCSSKAGEPTSKREASEPAGIYVSAGNGSEVTKDLGKALSPALLDRDCNGSAIKPECEHQASWRSAGHMTAEGAPEAARQHMKQATRLTCAELDWENSAHLAALGTFDVILVADVVCSPATLWLSLYKTQVHTLQLLAKSMQVGKS